MTSAAEQFASNLNFAAFAKAEELKKRLLFTLGALIVYRLGTFIPIPGINPEAYAQAFQSQTGGLLGTLNIFAGGAVERMAPDSVSSSRCRESRRSLPISPSSPVATCSAIAQSGDSGRWEHPRGHSTAKAARSVKDARMLSGST